jgi:hypothetical protein
VPFAGNLVTQVQTCNDSSSSNPSSSTYIRLLLRLLLSNAVIPPTGIKGCAGNDEDGLCKLQTFVNGAKEQVKQVDYKKACSGN